MKKLLTLLAMLMITMLVAPTLAQEIDLDATFEDERIRFDYPSEWEVIGSNNVVLLPTDNDDPATRLEIGFIFGDVIEEDLGIDVATSDLDEVSEVVANAIGQSTEAIIVREINNITIASMVDMRGDLYQIVSIIEDENDIIVVSISGDEAEVVPFKEIYFNVIATIELFNPDDEADLGIDLTQIYETTDGTLTFSYPDDWLVYYEESSFIMPDHSESSILIFPTNNVSNTLYENVLIELMYVDVYENAFNVILDDMTPEEAVENVTFALNTTEQMTTMIELGTNTIAYQIHSTNIGIEQVLHAVIDSNGQMMIARAFNTDRDIAPAIDVFLAIAQSINLSQLP